MACNDEKSLLHSIRRPLVGVGSALTALLAPRRPSSCPFSRVELMPNNPEPFKAKDWRAVAHGFDKLAFNFNARGQYLPFDLVG